MSHQPTVSVVIPTFNRAELLTRALESVRGQTVAPTEVLVVDDNSPDRTPQVMREFEGLPLRCIRHETNKGGSATRNTGIRAAAGEVIAFLDDDDRWLPQKLERQLDALGDCDALTCAYRTMDGRRRFKLKAGPITPQTLRRRPTPITSGWFVRADAVKALQFDETLPQAQDWDLLIRLATEYRVEHLDETLFEFDTGDHLRISNATRVLPVEELAHRLRAADKHRDLLGYWYYYRVAKQLTAYITHSGDAAERLRVCLQRAGAVATAHVMVERVANHLQRQWQRMLRPRPVQ